MRSGSEMERANATPPLTPADMGRRRWDGVPPQERSRMMRAARANGSGRPGKPTPCPKCGMEQASVRAAGRHCAQARAIGSGRPGNPTACPKRGEEQASGGA